jgi:hypothetical protein
MKSLVWIVVLALTVCAGTAAARTQDSNLAGTPQGTLVLAYYKAIQSGDLAGFKKCLTVESAKELDGPKGKEMFDMLKAMTPAVTPTISKVAVTGKAADVDAKVKEGDTTTTDHLKLVMVGADWKINTTGK